MFWRNLTVLATFVSLAFNILSSHDLCSQNIPGRLRTIPMPQLPSRDPMELNHMDPFGRPRHMRYINREVKRFPDAFYDVKLGDGKDTLFHGITNNYEGQTKSLEFINSNGLLIPFRLTRPSLLKR